MLTRAQLDGRTNAAKLFDKLVADIESDLGGKDQMTAIELALAEAFAGAAVTLANLNTRILIGEQVEISAHAQTISAMVRVASRLGISRRAKDVTPLALNEYLRTETRKSTARRRTELDGAEETESEP